MSGLDRTWPREARVSDHAPASDDALVPDGNAALHGRLALYYAPPFGAAWWRAGCAWLGRDADAAIDPGTADPADAIRCDIARLAAAIGRDVAALTVAPRRYGWHGTLVPPFRCAAGITPQDVLVAARDWAARIERFAVPVEPARIGDFVALRPARARDDHALRDIAASALHALAPLRARASSHENARRVTPGMTQRQRELLREWDYPYVLDEFRFHMTLSDSIASPALREAIAAFWAPRAAALGDLPMEGAALFVEPTPGAPFMLWQRVAFSGAARDA